MTAWVDGAALAGVAGVPSGGGSLTRWVERNGVDRRRRTSGFGWEYRVSTLPPQTQAALAARAPSAPAEATAPAEPGAPTGTILRGPWPQQPPPQPQAAQQLPTAPPVDPASLPAPGPIPGADALQQWAASRALRLSLKDLADPKVQAKLAVARALEVCTFGARLQTAAALAATHGVSAPTIRRWAEEVAGWRVRSRLPTLSMLDTSIALPRVKSFDEPALRRGIEIYAAAQRSGMKAAYAALVVEAAEQGWRVGDYSNFTRALGKVPARFWEYLAKGDTGFELSAVPKIVRAWLSVPAYSVLCGDQNIPDYLVCDVATGEVFTPELYLWMDCTSRAWVGLWPAWGHYSRYTVGAALREACRLGIPGEIFTDWGKPETSRYSAQLVAGLAGYCGVGDWSDYAGRYAGRDAISETDTTHRLTTRVGIPWQKPIEPQMAVLKRAYLDRFTPGFRQRLSGAWENDMRQADLRRQRESGKLLTTEEFFELTRDIARDHNASAMRPKETGGQPIVPGEVLARGLREAPRQVWDDLTLDLLFLPRVTRAPSQSLVRVQAAPGDVRHYYAPELSRCVKGERVQVSYDPFDPERPAVISSVSGDFMALAEPWAVQQPDDRPGLAHKIKRQMELMRWWRREVRALAGERQAAVPKIAAVTRTARQAEAAEQARPDRGASRRADAKLIDLYGGKR